MKYSILFLSILFSLAQMTWQASLPHNHRLTPRYNETAYSKDMGKRQAEFEKAMKDIQKQVDQLDKEISKFEGNDTYQLIKLQEGLADQRDALYDVEKILNKPFALKPCEKPNLTEEQKAQLNKQIKATNESLSSMKVEVKKCTESVDKCTVNNEIIHQISRAQLYLSTMNDYVNGECRRVPRVILPQQTQGLVDLNDRLYKDNLKAPNWVYGNITQEKYRLIVFAQTTKFNSTTCPIKTPFANKVNNTCFDCPKGSIFSLGERVCTCQNGYKFDQQSNECVSMTPIKPCNETGTCVSLCPKDKPHWNSVNKICEACPAGMPVINRTTSKCQPCPQATPLWNQRTYKCQACPKNTHFIPSELKCVPCKDDQKYEETTKKCVPICKPYQIYYKQEGKCYTLQEINGCKCNQRYNTTLRECEDACENGLQWLPSQKKCGPPALPDFKDKCKYYQRLNRQTNECENYCDSAVAWYDRENHVCIKIGCSVQCKCGQIFDNLTGKCIPESHLCPSGQFYNTTSQQCQIWCSNNLIYNPLSRNCELPRIRPSCGFDQIYNQASNLCVKRCPDYLQVFDPSTQLCDCIHGYHVDSFSGKCIPNPIACGPNQRYSQSQTKCICLPGFIMDNQGNCASMCDSRLNKVYDRITNRCICASGYVFNSDQSACISVISICMGGNNQHYDPISQSCVCDAGYTMNLVDGKCYEERKTCNAALHFVLNTQTNKCQCASGFRQSQDALSCVSLAEICLRNPNTFFNSLTSTCQCLPGFTIASQSGDIITCRAICKVDQTFNAVTKQCVSLCPDDYYFNTTTQSCLYRCSADYTFNKVTKQCEKVIKTCPDPINQYFDTNTGQCHSCPPGYNLNRNTLLCEKRSVACAPGQFYDDSTGLCKYCRSGQVYNPTSKVCQFVTTTCTGGMYFDFNLGECRYCSPGNVYDQTLLDCRPDCTLDQIFDYTKKQCVLISSTCTSYQYYDSLQRKCVYKAICTSLQRYDQIANKCVDITFITSITARNLIHSNFQSYVTYYNSRKASDVYLRDCPQNMPFYSSSTKNCVLCPPTHPYFDLESQKCRDCGNDRYDAALRRCVGLAQPKKDEVGELNYSLDRLVMNIV